jgi:hypothetical protein
MTKKDVVVGQQYTMNHTSGKIQVKILEKVEHSGTTYSKARTHWRATNLKTGREITVKSAMKLSSPKQTK